MLVYKDAYQRETLTKWPVRLPLSMEIGQNWVAYYICMQWMHPIFVVFAVELNASRLTQTRDDLQTCRGSGVASGWHRWTMSRGPGAKGAPERQTGKRKKKQKRKEKKRRKRKENRKEKKKDGKKKRKKKEGRMKENFQIPWRGPKMIYLHKS